MSELLDHISDNINRISRDEDILLEMSTLYQGETGIENWVIFVSSKFGRKRPRIKLARRGADTDIPRRNTVIYFDVVEVDHSKDNSKAPPKIKKRVLNFLKDEENNKNLLEFWNIGPFMSPKRIEEVLGHLNHY